MNINIDIKNRKLGNALYPESKTWKSWKMFSNFDSSCNLRWKNGKKLTETKT